MRANIEEMEGGFETHPTTRRKHEPTVIKLQVEKIRFFAYLAFWFMCLFAALVSLSSVAKTLGPCPLSEGADPTYGMHCSALMETFGFNNVRNSR